VGCVTKTLARIKRVSNSNQSIESALLLFFSLRIFVKKIIFLGIFCNSVHKMKIQNLMKKNWKKKPWSDPKANIEMKLN
jgi:hypothetical protein